MIATIIALVMGHVVRFQDLPSSLFRRRTLSTLFAHETNFPTYEIQSRLLSSCDHHITSSLQCSNYVTIV